MFSIIFEIFRTFPMILMIISFMDFLLYKSLYSLWLCIGLLLNGLIWEISTKYISLKWPSLEDRPNRYHCAYYEVFIDAYNSSYNSAYNSAFDEAIKNAYNYILNYRKIQNLSTHN